ncbi:DUF1919 domain-containing protein [Vibrio sp. G41H]|uniref:DUF1919 domain-containing protein n=1 Tax=unclassified Vibrio TaxID=2614977 RepID=UPI001AD61564|nr:MULTISPECIES: DUF1919 domain-containing protein [unclassified Vibrio]MBO7913689.1 DUF1919 domain-containing protein [Vibrio sp. G41H]MCF7492624.1 DUF1919 domain-containing protein [Vibrio sp. G-C-1]
MVLVYSKVKKRIISLIGIAIDRYFINEDNCPVIISNNCWGSGLYKNIRVEYLTPFVGLYILPKDYVALVKDFDLFLNSKMHYHMGLKYPIGNVNGVTIHFLHYRSVNEAKDKFSRRLSRMKSELNNNRLLVFKFCDVDFADDDNEKLIYDFHKYADLHGKSISFSRSDIQLRNSFKVNHKKTPNGIELFNNRYAYKNFHKVLKQEYNEF